MPREDPSGADDKILRGLSAKASRRWREAADCDGLIVEWSRDEILEIFPSAQ